MKHLHHIIPKHLGGTDDPSNLVELTIEEHAEAHKKLFEQHGRWEDELAYKGLSKMISHEECIRNVLSEAGKLGGKARYQNHGKEQLGKWGKAGAAANWEKNREAVAKTLRENARKSKELKEKTGRGLGGTPTGKYCWITDGDINKKVLISSDIPLGFRRGRTKKWSGAKKHK